MTNATQNVSTATATKLTWDTEAYDTTAYHDTGTNPERLTIPTTGKYRVSAGGFFGFTDVTEFDLWITLNNSTGIGNSIAGQSLHNQTAGKAVNLSFDREFTASDYIEAYCYHDNGSTRAFTNGYFTIATLDV